jgi:hypothetical protein
MLEVEFCPSIKINGAHRTTIGCFKINELPEAMTNKKIAAGSGFIGPLAIVAALHERRFPKIAMLSAVTDRRYRKPLPI